MNRTLIFTVLFLACSVSVFATKHTVTNTSSFTFSPNAITITLGDTVSFVLGSIHSAREVTKATWDVDGGTSNGGFDTPFGGGIVIPSNTGIYYFVCANHFAMGMKGTITVSPSTGVVADPSGLPGEFTLAQNTPNPFNPTTMIDYTLPVQSKVTLIVYNILGQQVHILADDVENPGYYHVEWIASELPSGIYFYKLQANGVREQSELFTSVKKMLLLK